MSLYPLYGGNPWSAEEFRILNGTSPEDWRAYWEAQYPVLYWTPTAFNWEDS